MSSVPTGGFVSIPVPHGSLEGILRQPAGDPKGAAVMCHPHPLYGGTMHTKVVYRTAQAMSDAGLAVLRFNFRGVGRSTGSYDNGVGEREDTRAAIAYIAGRYPGLPLVVGGFSFGSAVALAVGSADARVSALVGVGLAFTRHDFSFLREARRPLLIVQGEHDPFGPGPEAVGFARRLGTWAQAAVVPGADHFFHGHFDELRAIVRGFLARETARGAKHQTGDTQS